MPARRVNNRNRRPLRAGWIATAPQLEILSATGNDLGTTVQIDFSDDILIRPPFISGGIEILNNGNNVNPSAWVWTTPNILTVTTDALTQGVLTITILPNFLPILSKAGATLKNLNFTGGVEV